MDNKANTITETEFQENRLFFNAREWSLNESVDTNVGYRTFLNGPDGVLSEAFIIGDWQWNWTEIGSAVLTLKKNTLYKFVFWLNGGENDYGNETCQFAVIFDNDYDNRLIYNLNRNYIKPLKKLNGWLLYEIPFMTGDNEYTELRFMAMRAYMTVLHAEEPSAYADIPDTVDEFENLRPQRHNMVFNDGWPPNEWYNTENLKKGKIHPGTRDNNVIRVCRGGQHDIIIKNGNGVGCPEIIVNDSDYEAADSDAEQDFNGIDAEEVENAIENATDEFEVRVDELIEALANGQIDKKTHSRLQRELIDEFNSELKKIRKNTR